MCIEMEYVMTEMPCTISEAVVERECYLLVFELEISYEKKRSLNVQSF